MKKFLLSFGVMVTFVMFSMGLVYAVPAQHEDELKKKPCQDLIEKSQGDPGLYTAVLRCELNADDSFAAAGGDLAFGNNLESVLGITGEDLPTTGVGGNPPGNPPNNPPNNPPGILPPIIFTPPPSQ